MRLAALHRGLARLHPQRLRREGFRLVAETWANLPRLARRALAGLLFVAALAVGYALLPAAPAPPSVTVAISRPDGAEATPPPVTDPALIEEAAEGPLPRIGDDGRQPRVVYARPADLRDDRPRIALIAVGLGLSDEHSARAIATLPPGVSLAVDPYASSAATVATAARAAGHELFVVLPLESRDFPFDDPGPLGLLTSLKAADNTKRLRAVMARAGGYVGLVTVADGRFEADRTAIVPVLEEIGGRGLMYVDGRRSTGDPVLRLADEIGVARAAADLWIDDTPTAEAIDAALAALEERARRQAVAIGLGRLYPVTIDRVRRWADGLEDRGFVLTPASAIAGRQFLEGL